MTCAVISTLSEHRAFIAGILGGAGHDLISGGGRTYALTHANGSGDDLSYRDLDGTLLVSCRFFDNEAAARAWIAHDIAKAVAE